MKPTDANNLYNPLYRAYGKAEIKKAISLIKKDTENLSEHPSQPYTYMIAWPTHQIVYYGMRFGHGCTPKELGFGYKSSSDVVLRLSRLIGRPKFMLDRILPISHSRTERHVSGFIASAYEAYMIEKFFRKPGIALANVPKLDYSQYMPQPCLFLRSWDAKVEARSLFPGRWNGDRKIADKLLSDYERVTEILDTRKQAVA